MLRESIRNQEANDERLDQMSLGYSALGAKKSLLRTHTDKPPAMLGAFNYLEEY